MNREEYIAILETDNAQLKKENKDLQHQLEEKDKVIAEAINKIETLRMEKWSIMGTDIMEILDILERGKNGK